MKLFQAAMGDHTVWVFAPTAAEACACMGHDTRFRHVGWKPEHFKEIKTPTQPTLLGHSYTGITIDADR